MALHPGTRMHDSAEIDAAIAGAVGQDPSASVFTGTTTVAELDSTTIVNSGTATTGVLHSTTIVNTGTTTAGALSAAALTATGAVVLSNASITIANLGTVDPHVAGRLWANSGALTVSAG